MIETLLLQLTSQKEISWAYYHFWVSKVSWDKVSFIGAWAPFCILAVPKPKSPDTWCQVVSTSGLQSCAGGILLVFQSRLILQWLPQSIVCYFQMLSPVPHQQVKAMGIPSTAHHYFSPVLYKFVYDKFSKDGPCRPRSQEDLEADHQQENEVENKWQQDTGLM